MASDRWLVPPHAYPRILVKYTHLCISNWIKYLVMTFPHERFLAASLSYSLLSLPMAKEKTTKLAAEVFLLYRQSTRKRKFKDLDLLFQVSTRDGGYLWPVITHFGPITWSLLWLLLFNANTNFNTKYKKYYCFVSLFYIFIWFLFQFLL